MNASHVRKVLLPVLAGGMALRLALPDVGRAAAVYPIDRASMLAGALFDFKVACMSHFSLRGAAGGAVLLAELLAAKGYFDCSARF